MRGIVFDIDDTLYCRQTMLIKAAETVLGLKIPDWQEFMRIYYEKSDVNMQMLESGEVSTHDINGWRYNETFRILGLPYKPEDGGKPAVAHPHVFGHVPQHEVRVGKVLGQIGARPKERRPAPARAVRVPVLQRADLPEGKIHKDSAIEVDCADGKTVLRNR